MFAHWLTLLLCRSRFSQAEDVAAQGCLAPQSALCRATAELSFGMHYQDAVRRETVHFHVVLPLCCFLLRKLKEKKIGEIIVGKGQAMVKMENIQPKTT